MNLHDIKPAIPDDIALILRFFREFEYESLLWETTPGNSRSLRYCPNTVENPRPQDWTILGDRDALAYLNRARQWLQDGAPQGRHSRA